MLSLNICGRRVHLLFYMLTFHFIKYLQIWLVSLLHDHIALRVNLSLGFDVLFLSLSLWSESFILLCRLLFKDGSLVNIKWLRLCRRWFPTSVFYNVRARWLALSNIFMCLLYQSCHLPSKVLVLVLYRYFLNETFLEYSWLLLFPVLELAFSMFYPSVL